MRNISRFVLPGLLLLLSGCEDRPQQTYQWQHSEGSYAATFSADGNFCFQPMWMRPPDYGICKTIR